MAENLDKSLQHYANDHGVKVFPSRMNSGENSLTPSGHALQLPKGAIGSDFTTATSTKNSKEEKKSSKKITP
jgi:hypothetical protein